MGKKGKDSGKGLPQSVPPTSTVDPNAKKDNKSKSKDKDKKGSEKEKKEFVDKDKKEVINAFEDELTKSRRDNDIEVQKTIGKIRLVTKDSERLQRKQIHEYGMTLDMMEVLREEIAVIKQQNDDLLRQMTDAKDLSDKLEEEHTSTKNRFEEAIKTLDALKKESKTWGKAGESLQKSEDKCSKLTDTNKHFRLLLLKRRLNPTLELEELERKQQEQAVFKAIPRRRKVFEGEIFTSRSEPALKGLPNLYRMSKEQLQHDYGISHQTLDKVNPDYLGFYWKRQAIKKENKEKDSFRPGVLFPRILAKPKLLY